MTDLPYPTAADLPARRYTAAEVTALARGLLWFGLVAGFGLGCSLTGLLWWWSS